MPEKKDISIYLLSTAAAASVTEEWCMAHFPLRWEQSRKYRLEDDRLRSIAAGALLYTVLGLEEKDISVGRYGKPYAENAPCFNLSHGGDYAVLAVGECTVGVDIEPDNRENCRVARRVMTPEELRWMEELPSRRFPLLWTMKEAMSKAVGRGIGIGFEKYSVLPLLEGGSVVCDGMTLYGRSIAIPGHALAVCTESDIDRVEFIPAALGDD